MAEQSDEGARTGHAVLDIGETVGALVIYTREALRGIDLEVSPVGSPEQRTHTTVRERQVNGRTIHAALFLALPAGDYDILRAGPNISTVTIAGGTVAEIDWPFSTTAGGAVDHTGLDHRHDGTQSVGTWVSDALLPPRYRNGAAVSSAPMGSAPLHYDDDGQVAWDQLWTDFCDLAMAGGPPHRDEVLTPVAPAAVAADPDGYARVVAEIERGLRLVTGLRTVRGDAPGWVGLNCEDGSMARWLAHAITVENVVVRRVESLLYLPAGPGYRLDKEIKNVITVVAKTHHYWLEHRDG